ncbi:MAG: bifunctional UDP-sugar hydrolase/5'-nucleotidase [Candidatus Eisenbacteria bacterium]|nr:bifunctional UDP-sugar hydrolase/5'-nucleotidase [Candidatus Eisenbacteria bacterium]
MTSFRSIRGILATLVFTATVVAVVVMPLKAESPAPDVVEIDIIYTSDIHGHIDPQKATFLNPQFPPPMGGGASAATYIKKVRAEAEKAGRGFLMVDSGDLFQGTPVGMHFQGKSVIEWMNSVGYTAAALGNHDFDLGWKITEELVRTARFPLLCANLYTTGTNERVDWVKDMVIVEVAGVKTAIIGMVTEETAKISFAKNIDGLTFRPLHEMLPTKVEEARAQGAQFILFPVHAGLPYKPNLASVYRDMIEQEARGERPTEYEAMELAHYVPGVDIIFAGHSHQGYDQPWEDPVTHTLVVQPYANGSSVGHITVQFDRRLGKMIGYETHHDRGALVTLFEDEFWPDQGIAETIGAQVAVAEEGLDEQIGETRVNLQRGDADRGNLGALVADSIREFTGSNLAIQNTGGVRADIAPGPITKRDCLSVLPFGNTLVEAKVTGEFVRRLFEQKVGRYGPSLFISGATIEYDPTRAEGDRITSLIIGDKPLDPNTEYTVAMNNFLSEGNSGLSLIREVASESFRFTGYTDREALERYVATHSPINPKGESRWVRVSS